MPADLPSILVFDSGIGGLSVLDEMLGLLPRLRATYCADNRNYPYGLQQESVLIERVCHVIPELLRDTRTDLIVVACNSASTVVLDALRERVAVPVVGVVPAIKPAAEQSETGVIGLLATPGTVARHYTKRLIEQFAKRCEVISVGSNELVEEAEKKLRGLPLDENVLRAAIAPFLDAVPAPDRIVLGCTHFPLLRDELSALLPGISLIDSGAAIARRTAQLLGITPSPDVERVRELHFLFTEDTAYARQLVPALEARGFIDIAFGNL